MNTKKHLKALAVAAVVSMAAANASADVVAAVTANGDYIFDAPSGFPVPGMRTPSFNHPGGQLVAMYSAECAVSAEPNPAYGPAFVEVDIVVRDATGTPVATLSPTAGRTPFCSSSGAPGFNNRGSFSTTGVGTLPQGTYYVDVRAGVSRLRYISALMGARSLVVLR